MTVQPTVQSPVVTNPSTGTLITGPKDSNGNTIVDSGGLLSSAVLNNVAEVAGFTSRNYSGGADDIRVDGSIVSFNLTRAANVMILGNIPIAVSPANISELVGLYVDGTQQVSGNISGSSTASLFYVTVTLWSIEPLSAGAHVADWRLIGDSTGATWHIGIGGKIDVFLLGS